MKSTIATTIGVFGCAAFFIFVGVMMGERNRAHVTSAVYPAGARFEVIHIPPQGDNHHSYTKDSPIKVTETCMRWINMDDKLEIACGSVQIFGLEEYKDTPEAQVK